jgi:uncharacterized membrane protein
VCPPQVTDVLAQVLCNGLLPTLLCAALLVHDASTPHDPFRGTITLLILSHYACCCADTWASEVGMLATSSPILITTGCTVPPGTNGGVTLLGSAAAGCGGLLIGVVAAAVSHLSPGRHVAVAMTHVLHAYTLLLRRVLVPIVRAQHGRTFGLDVDSAVVPVEEVAAATEAVALVAAGVAFGVIGTMTDSLLGATLQYSGWDTQHRRVVARPGPTVKHISGRVVLDNNGVNLLSSVVTVALAAAMLAGGLPSW